MGLTVRVESVKPLSAPERGATVSEQAVREGQDVTQQEPIGARTIFWMWMGSVLAGFLAMTIVLVMGR